jgi:hypothetical protein
VSGVRTEHAVLIIQGCEFMALEESYNGMAA